MGVHVTDEDVLVTAKRYGLQPGGLKCEVFRLLDTGLTRAEIRFVLRDRKKRDDAGTFAGTIRTYCRAWEEWQAGDGESAARGSG